MTTTTVQTGCPVHEPDDSACGETEFCPMGDLFGDVIYRYTRADAIADGVLVDVSEMAREAGFTIPVVLTIAAWSDLVAWNDDNRAIQDEAGRLWDVLVVSRMYAKANGGASTVHGHVLRVPNTPTATVARRGPFVMVCGPGDDAEPVLTVMLNGED